MYKLNQKGFTGFEIALLLLVVALIGFAGYTVWQNNQPNSTNSDSKLIKKNAGQEAPATTTTDPYAGWKSYTSLEGGFSLKYPANWQLSGYTNDAAIDEANMKGNERQIVLLPKPNTTKDAFGLNLTIQNIPVNESPYDMYPNGTTELLDNTLTLWQEKENINYATGPAKAECPTIQTGTNGTFTTKLKNGKYLLTYGSYCWNQRSEITLSYTQQINSIDYKQAAQIIKSIKFQ